MLTSEFRSRLEGVRPAGSGWVARCPAHDDSEPSLSVKDVGDRTLVNCHAGCSTEDIVGALGLTMRDLFHRAPDRNGHPGGPTPLPTLRPASRPGLRGFAEAKGLAEDFLRERGLQDISGDRILIPYPTGARRYRMPDASFRWATDTTPAPYFFDLGTEGPIWIVEGESDVLTLAFHGIAAVGVPGATTWKDEWAALIPEGRDVILWREPDDGGAKLEASLRASPLASRLQIVDGTDEFKDPSDLHVLDPESFAERLQGLRGEARRPQRLTRTLADVLADPEALQPPRAVVDRFAWEGRMTLVAAREKGGKSTLASAMAVAVSKNESFLNAPVKAGPVLWVGPEEHPHDLARRLDEMGADPARLHVEAFPFNFDDPVAYIRAMVAETDPVLVIVDTLAAVTSSAVDDPHNEKGWTRFFRGLTDLARESNAAFVLLHHAKKSNGEYRDSTAIGANVDAILTMKEDGNVRRFDGIRARWRVPDFAVRFTGSEFELVDGDDTLETKLLAHIQLCPGDGLNAIARAVGGRKADLKAALDNLEAQGRIENRGIGSGHAYYLRRADG